MFARLACGCGSHYNDDMRARAAGLVILAAVVACAVGAWALDGPPDDLVGAQPAAGEMRDARLAGDARGNGCTRSGGHHRIGAVVGSPRLVRWWLCG
jgi:hypothetical protein